MSVELNPPNSEAVVVAADDAVDAYKAAGFTEVKAAPKRSTAKSDK